MSSLNYMELCRLCLVKDRVQIPIFEGEGDIRQIFLKIAACLPVKVKKDDKLPKKICDDCMYKVEMLYQFWNTTANAEKQLLEWLGEAVEEKKTNNDTHVKQESMEQDPGSELAKSLSRVEAVLAEAREAESDNDNFAGSNKAETDSDDEPLSSLEPTTFVNVGLNGSGTNESNTQGEFLAPGAPSTSKTNSTNAQMAASGLRDAMLPDDTNDQNNLKNVNINSFKISRKKKTLRSKTKEKVPPGLRRNKKRPDVCDVCRITLSTKEELIQHLQSEHNVVYVCTMGCSKIYKSSKTLANHEKLHSAAKEFICEVCGYASYNRGTVAIHRMRHTKAFSDICEVCDKGFYTRYQLEEHMNLHTGARPFTCEYCSKGFISKGTLKKHQISSHTDKLENVRQFPCEVCGKVFLFKRILMSHLKVHTGEKPYVCNFCGKRLCSSHSLNIHRRIHTGEKPFVCEVCAKAFGHIKYLKDHMHTHTGERPHSCELCGRCFSQLSSLTRHQRVHTGEKSFICNICGKQFSSADSLSIHRRNHTGEKPFTCEVCTKAFAHIKYLKDHMNTHVGEKIYCCDVCNGSFSQLNSLNIHKRSHLENDTFHTSSS